VSFSLGSAPDEGGGGSGLWGTEASLRSSDGGAAVGGPVGCSLGSATDEGETEFWPWGGKDSFFFKLFEKAVC